MTTPPAGREILRLRLRMTKEKGRDDKGEPVGMTTPPAGGEILRLQLRMTKEKRV